MTSKEGASLQLIMRSAYRRHLTRIIGVDMARNTREHYAQDPFDSGSQYLLHCSGQPLFLADSFLQINKPFTCIVGCNLDKISKAMLNDEQFA